MTALMGVCRGLCNKEIAAEMDCGLDAVKGLLKVVYLKLKVTSRTEALLESIKKGWFHTMNAATPLTLAEIVRQLSAVRTLVMASNPLTVAALPVRNKLSNSRYFKRVKGRRSASLRERSQKRKVTR